MDLALNNLLLLISYSSSMLLPSNQCSCFFTAVPSFSLDSLKTINLKAFQFPSTVLAGISSSLSLSDVSGSSLILLILIVLVESFLIVDLSFLILRLTRSLVVDLVITWSVLQLAPLITLKFRKYDRSRGHKLVFVMTGWTSLQM